ncbi:hypothetical protein PTKIN_Ptkin06aG0115400 [Pterospermum kingtungense]
MATEVGRADDNNMGTHLSDGINNYGAAHHHHGWPAITFQQAQPNFSLHYPYGQRLRCKQEQDCDANHTFHDLHQLQLGRTHNLFQPSLLHNHMSIEHSSASNSLIYSNEQSSIGGEKGSSYDQASACNNWLPTLVPTIAQRSSSVAVCRGAPTFTV